MLVDIMESLAGFDEQAWNALAADAGYYSSYHWVRSHDSMPGMRTAYVRVRSGADLVAVAPVWYAPYELSQEYSQSRLRDVFDVTGQIAMVGPRRGYRNDWLVAPWLPRPEREVLLGELIDACVEVARGWGLDSVAAPYLTESAARWLAAHQPVRACRSIDREAILDLPTGAFSDYLATLPKKRRYSVLRERAGLRKWQLAVQVEAASAGSAEVLADLVRQVEAKYGRRATTTGIRRYLQTTFEGDPAHARLFACRNPDGRVISAVLAYEWGPALFVRASAADYESIPADSMAYFNVMFYEPIEYSLAKRLKRIYYGPGTLDTKRRRGCRIETLHHILIR